jgi:parallel beta-helix repeat protein
MMALDKKQNLSLFAVFVLLFSAVAGLYNVNLGSANYVPWVWHNSSIFIQSNGTIVPSSAPIRFEGNVYTLTGDISGGIAIQKNGTVLDGRGFRLSGNYYGTGVVLQNVTNVAVKNMNVQYFEHGIYLENSNSIIIQGNTLTMCGIVVAQNSTNNQIKENTVKGDISVEFTKDDLVTQNKASVISTSWSTNITITSNKVSDDKPIGATLNLGNYTEGIYIDNSCDCNVSGNTVERKNVGIDIWESINLVLTGNVLRDNQVGFKLWGSDLLHNLQSIDTTNFVNGKPVYFLVNITDYQVPTDTGWIVAVNCRNVTVQNLVLTPNWDGVLFVDTQDSRIVNSKVTGNFNAIRFQNASYCTITQNTLSNNQFAGLYFEGVTSSVVAENEVVNNGCFFDIWHNSTGNMFYHNDFVGNWAGSLGKESRNQWDNGVEGNYWSTFTGVDLNHNGISDTGYVIDSSSGETDWYPLMAQNSQAAGQTATSTGLVLSMPEECLSYTIANVNGALWAKIDGVYPIHLASGVGEALPMVYPTPPGTINMHVKLDGTELSWSNYSDIDQSAVHYTDIGNWQMIYCTINTASTDFLLEIHYEHPVEIVNGSYTFLYDLNISPYLSASSVISTAHFNILLPANQSGLNVYTTGSVGKWSPVNYTRTTNAQGETVTFTIVSEYGKPLRGDIAFVLGDSQIPEFSAWAIPVLFAAVTLGVVAFYVKDDRRKTANSSVCHGKN